MWLLQIDRCNTGMVYADCPTGDSPEIMSLDSSLFELHAHIWHHDVTRTMLPENINPQKFPLLPLMTLPACTSTSSILLLALKLVFTVHGITYKIWKGLLLIVMWLKRQKELWSLVLVPGKAIKRAIQQALPITIMVEHVWKIAHMKPHGFILTLWSHLSWFFSPARRR